MDAQMLEPWISQATVELLGRTGLHFLWQGTVVAVVLAAGLALLKGRSAEVRYAMACAAMLVLLGLPVATLWALQGAAEAGVVGAAVDPGGIAWAVAPPQDLDAAHGSDHADEDPYRYDAIGKRDPYRSYTSMVVGPPRGATLTALQRWELQQLRLVGVMVTTDGPVAMVETPDGQGHVVQFGDYLGRRWGQVSQIGDGSITVTEKRFDPETGRWLFTEYDLRLPFPEMA